MVMIHKPFLSPTLGVYPVLCWLLVMSSATIRQDTFVNFEIDMAEPYATACLQGPMKPDNPANLTSRLMWCASRCLKFGVRMCAMYFYTADGCMYYHGKMLSPGYIFLPPVEPFKLYASRAFLNGPKKDVAHRRPVTAGSSDPAYANVSIVTDGAGCRTHPYGCFVTLDEDKWITIDLGEYFDRFANFHLAAGIRENGNFSRNLTIHVGNSGDTTDEAFISNIWTATPPAGYMINRLWGSHGAKGRYVTVEKLDPGPMEICYVRVLVFV